MKTTYGFTFPWWPFLVLATLILFVLSYVGVRVAVGAAVVLGMFEILIVTGLGVSGLIHPGTGGLNLVPFNPSAAPSTHELYLAVIFTILAIAGFESTVPLAEESAHPRRNLPLGIMLAIIIAGVFYVFTAWGLLVGYGTHNMAQFIASKENPVFVLARGLWGPLWIIVFLAVLNSVFGIAVASQNAATRVLFAMGRGGALPRALGRVHPRYRTPVTAISLQALVTLALGLALGFWLGPDSYFFSTGIAFTIGIIVLYVAGNGGAVRFFLTERRAQFKPLPHLVFPLVSSGIMAYVLYRSLVPLPAPPTKYVPFLVVVWFVLGVVWLVVINRRGTKDWLLDARRFTEVEPP